MESFSVDPMRERPLPFPGRRVSIRTEMDHHIAYEIREYLGDGFIASWRQIIPKALVVGEQYIWEDLEGRFAEYMEGYE